MAAEQPVRGPLDDVLRRAGATMVERDGRWVAAHFGSRAGEVAACRGAVGIADRSDRVTFELRGAPEALDAATGAETGVAVADLTDDYAAIELIGPRVRQVLRAAGFNPLVAAPEGADTLVLLAEAGDTFELLSRPDVARVSWTRLQDAGRPLGATCVGIDALDLLAAGDHLDAAGAQPASG